MASIIEPRTKITLFILSLFISGCGSKNASHLPSIFELPGMIIGSTVENATYNAKRKKVERYVSKNYELLRDEVKVGDGVHFQELIKLADIKESKHTEVKKKLQESYDVMFHNTQMTTEAVMNSFGALYMPKKETKKMNGFSYTEASNIVKNYLDKNFEGVRLDMKTGSTSHLQTLVNLLRIDDSQKQTKFINRLQNRYIELYENHVTASVMIFS